MKITTKYGVPLSTYYTTHSLHGLNCPNNNKTHWYRFTPYDLQETLYYLCKHFALPSFGVIIFLLVLIFRILNVPVSDLFITLLLYISGLFFLSVLREKIRAVKYKIKCGKIGDICNYQEEEEETLFTIRTNIISRPNIRIGFVGDIMMLKKLNLIFDCEVREFFKDVDLIVGNLEGIIHNVKCIIPPKQLHRNPPILNILKSLKTFKTEWLLSVSNNHSADYGNNNFCGSLLQIQEKRRFNVFGGHLVPTVLCEYTVPGNEELRNDISISTVSEWCNQKKWNCIFKYEDARIQTLHRLGKFNILFPHWSYENEKYVRTRIQKDAITLLTGKTQRYSLFQRFVRKFFVTKITPFKYKKWDLIFGHHSHVRQPIMLVMDNFTGRDGNVVTYNKLVAFSGGNFTSRVKYLRKKKHIRGIILKCDIGPLEGHPEKIVVGNVKWRKTVNKFDKNLNPHAKVVGLDREKYITYNRGAFIWGVILTAIMLPIYIICVLL